MYKHYNGRYRCIHIMPDEKRPQAAQHAPRMCMIYIICSLNYERLFSGRAYTFKRTRLEGLTTKPFSRWGGSIIPFSRFISFSPYIAVPRSFTRPLKHPSRSNALETLLPRHPSRRRGVKSCAVSHWGRGNSAVTRRGIMYITPTATFLYNIVRTYIRRRPD
jgi:hypothetical protein